MTNEMASKRLKTMIGIAMVGVGVVQAALFTLQQEWFPMILGLLYAGIGVAFLWAEVYTVDR